MEGEGRAGMRFLGYGFEHGVLDEWRGRGWSPESGQLHSVCASAAPSRKRVPILEVKKLRFRLNVDMYCLRSLRCQDEQESPDLGGQYSNPTIQ